MRPPHRAVGAGHARPASLGADCPCMQLLPYEMQDLLRTMPPRTLPLAATVVRATNKGPSATISRAESSERVLLPLTLHLPANCGRGQVWKVISPIQLMRSNSTATLSWPPRTAASAPISISWNGGPGYPLEPVLTHDRQGVSCLGPGRRRRRARHDGLFPTHQIPPPARTALILAVRGPHWLRVHQSAPEIRESRLGRLHKLHP